MVKTLLTGRDQQSKRLIQYLLLLSSFIDDATNNVSTTTDATTAEYNGMAVAIILGGLMGFLVLIIATDFTTPPVVTCAAESLEYIGLEFKPRMVTSLSPLPYDQ